MPRMDVSAEHFVDALESVGVRFFNTPRRVIRVLKEVSLSVDGRHVTLSPSMRYTLDVTFQSDRLPGQNARCIFRPLEDDFSGDLSGARTFGFFEDAEKIKAMGLAKGASLENTVVFDQEGEAMNDAGLRYEDECVRHKVLDAMGDLHLAGGLLMGHLKGTGVGHTTNHKILVELFKDPTAWCIETL